MLNSYLAHLAAVWAEHCAPRHPSAPAVVSTFAGAGGSSLGYSMAGFRELLAVEKNDNAVTTFRHNFPGVTVFHGDICELEVATALHLAGVAVGELDLLDGSPPCQGFSAAGRRDPSDPRNGLFREFVRLLRGLKPKVFVMENVSGMVRGAMRLVFSDILAALKESGYQVSARLMNTMYFRVPQSRERLIFVGVRADLCAAKGLEPSHPRAQYRPISMAAAIGDLGDVQDPARGHVWLDESPSGRNTKTWPLAHQARQGARYAGQQRRYVWDKPCGTLLTASAEHQAMDPYLRSIGCHPLYTRTLSLLEYKRIASFPDAFEFVGPRKFAYNRIGNCVPPLFMRAIAAHIRAQILERRPNDQT